MKKNLRRKRRLFKLSKKIVTMNKKRSQRSQRETKRQKVQLNKKKKRSQAKKTEKDSRMPIEVIYCGVCGVPPEYCNFANKNSDPCKEWLNKGYPDLSDIIYPKEDDGQEEEKK